MCRVAHIPEGSTVILRIRRHITNPDKIFALEGIVEVQNFITGAKVSEMSIVYDPSSAKLRNILADINSSIGLCEMIDTNDITHRQSEMKKRDEKEKQKWRKMLHTSTMFTIPVLFLTMIAPRLTPLFNEILEFDRGSDRQPDIRIRTSTINDRKRRIAERMGKVFEQEILEHRCF